MGRPTFILVLPVLVALLLPQCRGASPQGAANSPEAGDSGTAQDSSRIADVPCDPGRGAARTIAGFSRVTVDDAADGPGYVTAADVNGDTRRDLVVTSLGHPRVDDTTVALAPGAVTVYLQGPTAGCWHKSPIAEVGPVYFPNEPAAEDVDGDGDLDLVVPAGFFVCAFDKKVGPCGALAWLENAGKGAAWIRHDIVPAGSTRFFHRAVLTDVDGDGTRDLLSVAESSAGARAMWFRGNGSKDRFDAQPREMGDGLGSFPVVFDVDGDGLLDVASAEYFVPKESFAWLRRVANPTADQPAGVWERHVIDDTSGRGFMLDVVPNLYGDGVARVVATNHVNASDDASQESAVFVFDRPADPTTRWTRNVVSSGIVSRPSEGQRVQGAPGVFGWGDIDGDGDVDLAVSGDGDARTFWLEQASAGHFTMHELEPSLGQASGARIVDLDGDGKNEVVFTGYENDAVYVYTRGNGKP